MSLDVSTINIGAQANDGTGDAIRTAFGLVNTNFYNLDTRISNGNIAVINASLGVTAGQITSNSSVTTQTLTVNNAANFAGTITANNLAVNNTISGTTITTSGNINVGGTLNAITDVIVNGNLTVIGHTTTVSTVDTAIQDSLIHLHTPANAAPLLSDDGKDIGFLFNYYKGSDKTAALVWANDSQSLELYATGAHTGNVFVGSYGNMKAGSFFAGNTDASAITTLGGVTANTANISNITAGMTTSGNLTVTNKIIGSLHIGGPGSTDTIYVNGVPVATALSSFNGGPVGNTAWFQGQLIANSQVASTSISSGSLVVDGGVGISGSLYAGAIVNTPISGSTGDFTNINVSNTFAATSVSFLGGYISGVHGDATQWVVTDLTSGNVKITGGTVTGLTSLGASGANITSGSITGLSNLTSAAATITSGSITGLSQVTTNNLSSSFGLVSTGSSARIAGDFTSSSIATRLIFQTTIANGATNISAMPRGTVPSGQVVGSFRIEDNTAVATAGASGGLELYQDTELRLSSTVRGGGTYLPLTIYTNGSKNAQYAVNHDYTVYNTSGSGVVTLGANGAVIAASFTGHLIGNAETASVASSVAWSGITGTPSFATVATSGAYADLSGKPSLSTVATSGAYNDLTGKPSLATVALSGSYTDLTNKPTIPTVPTVVSAFTNDAGYIPASGNAATATKFQTARNINGIAFDGTADITIPGAANASASGLIGSTLSANVTASSLTSVGTLSNLTVSGLITGSVAGAKFTQSSSAPASPTVGDEWYNTASDILYKYIGTAWVDVFTAGITATSTATANAIVQRDGSAGAAFSALTASSITVSGTPGLAATGNGTQNIGSASNRFGTIYGLSTSAQYADLAEIYAADAAYEPGTLVVFGGPAEITVNDRAYDTRVAGVISTNPAYLMNDNAKGLPVALTGRVPCKVIGPINKGDLLVASKFPGIAQAIDNSRWLPGCVLGKALGTVSDTIITTIEVVIGRF